MVADAKDIRARRAQAAQRYKPDEVELLLVAEAPPADSGRYFYFEDVQTHDSLFRYVTARLFGLEPTREKEAALLRLRDTGVYLIDLKLDPMDGSPLVSHVPDLIARCRALDPKHIILIKATVYDTAAEAVSAAGLPLVDRKIPFPGSGQQRRFEREFEEALRECGWQADSLQTRFSATRSREATPYDDISLAIRARHFETPLDRALVLAPDTSANEAHERLLNSSFDQAPVVESEAPIAYAMAVELAKPTVSLVRDAAHPLGAANLISAEASFPIVLRRLAESRFLFVVDESGVTGFLTPSDVNKQPGKTYFFLLLAELELLIADLLRRELPRRTMKLDLLGPEQRDDVERRFQEQRERNVDADLVAAMTNSQMLGLVAKSRLFQLLGYPSRSRFEDETGRIVAFRHVIMHPARELMTDREGLAELIGIDERLRDLVTCTRTALGTR